MSNPLDSQKKITKLLKTKTAEFSVNNGLKSNCFKKSQNNNLIWLKNPKNNNIILIISIQY